MQPAVLLVPLLAMVLTGFVAPPDVERRAASFDLPAFDAMRRDVPLRLTPQAVALLARFDTAAAD